MIHWAGAALYALPWYSYYNPEDVTAGLEQSTYAIVAFSIGYLILIYILERRAKSQGSSQSRVADKRPKVSDTKLTNLYIGIGAACYIVSMSVLSNLPTITSLISGGWNLVVVGLMLKCWRAWYRGNQKAFLLWLAVSSGFPLLTIITQGFLGYGTFAALMVFAFVARFYRPRWRLVVLGLAVGYFGLSLYVTYMRDRGDIRETVWGGQSYGTRIDQLKSTFSQGELFDPYNTEHLERIDLRLNQDALVGASVRYMESGRQDFARGETLWQAFIALIPRAIWPDKPVTAGSGDLVATYTGYHFDEGTSVGIGQVMEFYINFGQSGVIIGFLILGSVIALIDKGAGESLLKADWLTFTCWYLPGIAFLQVGGSLVEVTASAAASLAVAVLVKYCTLLEWHDEWRRQPLSVIQRK
jgi:hypothetical protein